jgi:hypothetical protein
VQRREIDVINRITTQLVDELRADDVADPLRERLLLAAIWDDLCRLAGEALPARVRLALEDSAPGDVPMQDVAE